MPNNRHVTSKTVKGKDNLHPYSRKAGQLTRVNLRTAKLQHAHKARKDLNGQKLQRPLFFVHAITSPHPLSLSSFRALITGVYLSRYDARITELEAERRPGRAKATELVDLQEVKRQERAEYESGLEVIDLTHAPTVRYLYTLINLGDNFTQSHLDILRQVRISRDSDELILARKGRTDTMGLDGKMLDTMESLERDDWTGLGRTDEEDMQA